MFKKIKEWLFPSREKWMLVYQPKRSDKDNFRQMYLIKNPLEAKKLFNHGKHVGFTTKVYNRDGEVRSFRLDRIVSLSKC